MAPFTMTSFGPAKASKRALLFCGSVQMGYCWWKIAEYLVDGGYQVDCPDIQPDVPSHKAEDQAKYILDQIEVPKQGYDLVGGINLGALMSLEIIKHLEIPPRRVLLIEPPIGVVKGDRFEMFLAGLERVYQDTNEKSLRELVNKPNLGHRIDWTAKRLAILRNSPASIKRNALSNTVDHSIFPASKGPSEIVVIAADPSKGPFYNIDEKAAYMAENYPHIRLVVATDTGHDLLLEAPELTAKVLLAEDITKVKEVRVVQ